MFGVGDGTWTSADLAVRDGRIVDRAPSLSTEGAKMVADVEGALVVPGLVDLHLHAYPDATFWGIDADAACARHGVTSFVDAGSAGAYTFAGLAKILRTSRMHARALLNIASGGLAMPHGELLAPEAADVDAAVRVARDFPDLIVGLKLRASPNTVGAHDAAALAAVRRAADDLDLPVMVHVSEAPPDLGRVLDHLRGGDVLTHCFTPYDNAVVDEAGQVRRDVREAIDRGVLLDVGHGGGSFSFPKAEAYAASNDPIPITSTDLHKTSVLGPAYDMCTVMSKMLAAGFALEDVLRSATAAPASFLGRNSTLREGAEADIAVLVIEEETWTTWDSRDVERKGDRRLRCRMTVRRGEVLHVTPDQRLVRRR